MRQVPRHSPHLVLDAPQLALHACALRPHLCEARGVKALPSQRLAQPVPPLLCSPQLPGKAFLAPCEALGGLLCGPQLRFCVRYLHVQPLHLCPGVCRRLLRLEQRVCSRAVPVLPAAVFSAPAASPTFTFAVPNADAKARGLVGPLEVAELAGSLCVGSLLCGALLAEGGGLLLQRLYLCRGLRHALIQGAAALTLLGERLEGVCAALREAHLGLVELAEGLFEGAELRVVLFVLLPLADGRDLRFDLLCALGEGAPRCLGCLGVRGQARVGLCLAAGALCGPVAVGDQKEGELVAAGSHDLVALVLVLLLAQALDLGGDLLGHHAVDLLDFEVLLREDAQRRLLLVLEEARACSLLHHREDLERPHVHHLRHPPLHDQEVRVVDVDLHAPEHVQNLCLRCLLPVHKIARRVRCHNPRHADGAHPPEAHGRRVLVGVVEHGRHARLVHVPALVDQLLQVPRTHLRRVLEPQHKADGVEDVALPAPVQPCDRVELLVEWPDLGVPGVRLEVL